MTDSIAVRTESLYPVGDLEAELAALVEPISIGLHAVVRGAVSEEDRVVVFGAGPIGQAVLLVSTDRGACVLVVDKLEERLQLAHKLGAERTLKAGQGDVIQIVRDWTEGDGPSVVFDATGVPAVIRSAVDLAARHWRLVIIGLSAQEVAIPITVAIGCSSAAASLTPPRSLYI